MCFVLFVVVYVILGMCFVVSVTTCWCVSLLFVVLFVLLCCCRYPRYGLGEYFYCFSMCSLLFVVYDCCVCGWLCVVCLSSLCLRLFSLFDGSFVR